MASCDMESWLRLLLPVLAPAPISRDRHKEVVAFYNASLQRSFLGAAWV